MVRTIHCRPMVMIILMLGLALMTFSKPGHAAPQQRHRPHYQCQTCSTSTPSLGKGTTGLLEQLVVQTGMESSRLKRVVEHAVALSLQQGQPDYVTHAALSQALQKEGIKVVVDAETVRRLQEPATILGSPSTRRPQGRPHKDIEGPLSEDMAPSISIDSDESPQLVDEARVEELTPSEPVNPLEIIGAAVVLLFLVIEGLRWERRRNHPPQSWRKSGVRKLPTSVQR